MDECHNNENPRQKPFKLPRLDSNHFLKNQDDFSIRNQKYKHLAETLQNYNNSREPGACQGKGKPKPRPYYQHIGLSPKVFNVIQFVCKILHAKLYLRPNPPDCFPLFDIGFDGKPFNVKIKTTHLFPVVLTNLAFSKSFYKCNDDNENIKKLFGKNLAELSNLLYYHYDSAHIAFPESYVMKHLHNRSFTPVIHTKATRFTVGKGKDSPKNNPDFIDVDPKSDKIYKHKGLYYIFKQTDNHLMHLSPRYHHEKKYNVYVIYQMEGHPHYFNKQNIISSKLIEAQYSFNLSHHNKAIPLTTLVSKKTRKAFTSDIDLFCVLFKGHMVNNTTIGGHMVNHTTTGGHLSQIPTLLREKLESIMVPSKLTTFINDVKMLINPILNHPQSAINYFKHRHDPLEGRISFFEKLVALCINFILNRKIICHGAEVNNLLSPVAFHSTNHYIQISGDNARLIQASALLKNMPFDQSGYYFPAHEALRHQNRQKVDKSLAKKMIGINRRMLLDLSSKGHEDFVNLIRHDMDSAHDKLSNYAGHINFSRLRNIETPKRNNRLPEIRRKKQTNTTNKVKRSQSSLGFYPKTPKLPPMPKRSKSAKEDKSRTSLTESLNISPIRSPKILFTPPNKRRPN